MKTLLLALLVFLLIPLSACDRHDRDTDDQKPVYIKDKDGTWIRDPNCKNGKCPLIRKQEEVKK